MNWVTSLKNKLTIGSRRNSTTTAQDTVTANTTSARSSGHIAELLFPELNGPDLLFLGPTKECVCGNNVFHALIWFNDEREIAGYFTEMACAFCGALLRGVTPIDQEVLPND